jgi:hypothetical protein
MMQVPESMQKKGDDNKELEILRAPTYFRELENVAKEQVSTMLALDETFD